MAADGSKAQAEVSEARLTRLPPVGFWSYARPDGELSFGKLSTLRSLLIHELQQLRQREQGNAGFSLTIAPNGRVSDCRITSGSGSPSLDRVTCRILRSRARFIPARDSAGQTTTGSYDGRVAWRLPDAVGL